MVLRSGTGVVQVLAPLLGMEECAAAALPCLPMAWMSKSPKAAVAAARLSWRGSPGSLSFPLALSTTGVRRVADLEVLNGINTLPAWLAWHGTVHARHAHHLATYHHQLTSPRPHPSSPQGFVFTRLWV